MHRMSPAPLAPTSLCAVVALVALLLGSGCSGPDAESTTGDSDRTSAQPQAAGPVAAQADQSVWSDVPPGDPPYNLLLISLDTTRRDHLSCYGFDRPTTPNIDGIAERGVRRVLEIGPGRVLTGLVARVARGIERANLSSCATLDEVVAFVAESA